MIDLIFSDKTESYLDPKLVVERIFSLYKVNKEIVKSGERKIIGIRNKGDNEADCAKIATLLEKYYFGQNAEKVKTDTLKLWP